MVKEKFFGCLLGGAYGDAVGAGVEFLSKKEICQKFPSGVGLTGYRDLGPLSITDDTQQTLAVCEGLAEMVRRDINDAELSQVWLALKRWRARQDLPGYARAPGYTSLAALSEENPGTFDQPLNLSHTCGGVMRAHPIGLYHYRFPVKAFDAGMQSAVITHGSPEAYVPAGLLAATVALTLTGLTLDSAVSHALRIARSRGYAQTNAYRLATEALEADPSSTDIESFGFGSGWDGDESFAMAVHAARRYPTNIVQACSYAAAIDGDSDSVASTTGAIVGSLIGIERMPSVCLQLELARSLMRCAEELYTRSSLALRSVA